MEIIVPAGLTVRDIESMNEVLSSDPESAASEDVRRVCIISGGGLADSHMTGMVPGLLMTDLFNTLIDQAESLVRKRKDVAIVEKYLTLRGYVQKDGSKDYVRFYRDAYISSGTWSKFNSGTLHQDRTKPETLFKMIVALRMSLDDAILFLRYAGGGFFSRSKRDMVIYAYIKKEYLGRSTPFEAAYTLHKLIAYYSKKEMEKSTSGHSLKSLYAF